MWVADVEKVHLYRRHQDITAQQMAQYKHRTSLFREELHRGNVSLKITNVKRADSNDYHCYVPMNGGYEGTTVHLYVDDLGTNPEMSAQSHVNASVNLTCTSAGWSHRTRPEILWLNSVGEVLQHIHISKHYVQGQHTFYIKAVATVLQTADDRYTCIVSYLGHKKEREFMVPGEYQTPTM
ncbi:butyrophilin subfamily 1 member A1-like [Engraulis encrasicolus]|uniref:butyrophilin subfamily 1 member A1-like n=1 Tax=Engraulis encrasicolus TaxID=184585 RepID=UPI002FD1EDF8